MNWSLEDFRPEWEFVAETPCGQDVTAMVNFNGTLYVSTANRVYWLDDAKKLRPVEFAPLPTINPELIPSKEKDAHPL
jgi:hypothetical protein